MIIGWLYVSVLGEWNLNEKRNKTKFWTIWIILKGSKAKKWRLFLKILRKSFWVYLKLRRVYKDLEKFN